MLATKLATKLPGSVTQWLTDLLIERPIPFAAIVQREGTKFRFRSFHPRNVVFPIAVNFALLSLFDGPGPPPRSVRRVADSRGRRCAGTWLDKNMLRRADEKDRPTRCIQQKPSKQPRSFWWNEIAIKPEMNSKERSTLEIKKWILIFLLY